MPSSSLAFCLLAGAAWGQATYAHTYSVIDALHVGGEGKWDYTSVDSAAHRLYLSRETHVMVIDTASGKVVGDIATTAEVTSQYESMTYAAASHADYGALDPSSPTGRALANVFDSLRPPGVAPSLPTLSNDDLRSLKIELARHQERLQKVGYGTRLVARHGRANVAVTITCADICPLYTHAELSYDVRKAGPATVDANACIDAGGVVIERGGMMVGSYCYPGVLYSTPHRPQDSSQWQALDSTCKFNLGKHPELTEKNRNIMLQTCKGA